MEESGQKWIYWNCICAAAVVRKTVGILRLYEYRHLLRSLKNAIPTLKREISRREFLSLKVFTFKNAWNNHYYRSCCPFNCAVRYEPMNTALTIIGLSMLIFLVVFYLKRAKEKRKAWLEEREKIKAYGEEINEETRNKNKWKIKNSNYIGKNI